MATARLSRAFIRRLDNFRRIPQYSSPQLLKYNHINSLNGRSYRFFSTSHLKYEQQQVKQEETQGWFHPLYILFMILVCNFNFITLNFVHKH